MRITDVPTMSSETPASESRLRSALWFEGADLHGFCHRAWLRHDGFSDEALRGRPVIGISNMWSELVGCNVHLRGLAEAVKRGVLQAGGLPLEFPVMTPGDALQKPAAMMYRNLASMDVEETIRSNPLDAVGPPRRLRQVRAGERDGCAERRRSLHLVTGGPALPGFWRGERVGSGTGYWKFADMARLGEISAEEYLEAEAATNRSQGHCMDMGTASTMASVCEALGITLPGCRRDPRRRRPPLGARRAKRPPGRRARARGNPPSSLVTRESLENAIRVLEAIAGSTNAIIHLIAIAGRLGVELTLDDFRAAAATPVLANIEPTGAYLMEDFFHAGGVQAVVHELLPHLHGRRADRQRTDDRRERGRSGLAEPRRDQTAQRPAPNAERTCDSLRLARP